MEDNSDKSDYVPTDKRISDSSPLYITELETLDRLCEIGEMLVIQGGHFYQANTLVTKGYAKVVHTYKLKDTRIVYPVNPTDQYVNLIKPTQLGLKMAEIRMRMKLKREEEISKTSMCECGLRTQTECAVNCSFEEPRE